MKALQVNYDKEDDKLSLIKDQIHENWAEVCERFNHDVHRLRNAAKISPYTGLYVCYDEDNQPVYFLVEEDAQLKAMQRSVFRSKLGR